MMTIISVPLFSLSLVPLIRIHKCIEVVLSADCVCCVKLL